VLVAAAWLGITTGFTARELNGMLSGPILMRAELKAALLRLIEKPPDAEAIKGVVVPELFHMTRRLAGSHS
jgi:hypothetical protein